jgi:hypothetical protein
MRKAGRRLRLWTGALVAATMSAANLAADTTRTYSTGDAKYGGKDAGLGTYDVNGNCGGKWSMRAGKPGNAPLGQNYALYDWNRTNIVADLDTVAKANGWDTLQQAYGLGKISIEFGVKPASTPGDPPTKTLHAGFFASQTGWVEGDATDQDAGYNWSTNTSAATDSYAVNWRPGDAAAQPPTPWRQNGTNLPNMRAFTFRWNSQPMTNFVQNQFTFVPLDPALWWSYMSTTNAGPGLITRDGGTGGSVNMTIYTKEQNAASAPQMRVTIYTRPLTLFQVW